jgi:hypothetical protein
MAGSVESRLDHNAAMSATRSCHVCRRVYAAGEIHSDPAWEPTRRGWRCGDCSRAWARHVNERVAELIASTEPRWTLVLRSTKHSASDECLECEALEAARRRLLARGALTKAETDSLCDAVLSGA